MRKVRSRSTTCSAASGLNSSLVRLCLFISVFPGSRIAKPSFCKSGGISGAGSNTTTHLGLPCLPDAQAQKHATRNAPPASPGAPRMTDRGASFAAATGGALTLFITTPPNGSSIWVCLVDEVPGGGGRACDNCRRAHERAVPVAPAVGEQRSSGGNGGLRLNGVHVETDPGRRTW